MDAQIAECTIVPCDDALDLLDLGRRRYDAVLVVGTLQRKGAPTDRLVDGDGRTSSSMRSTDS